MIDWGRIGPNMSAILLTHGATSDNILIHAWGRGVAVNTSACQAEDRGFDPRRSRGL